MDLTLTDLPSANLSWLSLLFQFMALAGCVYGLTAAFLASRYARRPVPVLAAKLTPQCIHIGNLAQDDRALEIFRFRAG